VPQQRPALQRWPSAQRRQIEPVAVSRTPARFNVLAGAGRVMGLAETGLGAPDLPGVADRRAGPDGGCHQAGARASSAMQHQAASQAAAGLVSLSAQVARTNAMLRSLFPACRDFPGQNPGADGGCRTEWLGTSACR
jgi:hypothetical protein